MSTPNIFISYAHADANWTRRFAQALRADGVDVWLDTDQIAPGENISKPLSKALRGSKIFVSIVTPESLKSPNVFFELGAAVADGKRVVPVIADDMNASLVPPYLQTRQPLVRTTPKDTARRLVAQLNLREIAA